ncbi:MAG: hypothetical protein KC729_09245 [Candidatus Eisenbacteria bacterium]|uniref:Glycosyl transferase family 28 C-terminal domain-containing protein n=1 Tax=Eiseniibacteriota bacterium TaxID=2212470 RepID=A0A956LYH0_UNCEI|nr:hypothetical protein [Candidatus Eisenbacteria bacterium]
MRTGPIVYYITAHGYGHGVRSADILNAIARLAPSVDTVVVSTLDPAFLRSRLDHTPREFRSRALDVGMVQLDSVRLDVERSRRAAAGLLDRWDELVVQERAFHDAVDASVVVADIPAIPIEAAASAGRPAIAVGNFAWDWIYEPYAESDSRWSPIVERFRRGYGRADLLLRLPFSEPMAVFPICEDLPLLSTPVPSRRDDLARHAGADAGKRWTLISFTTLEWGAEALDRVEAIPGTEFFSVLPLVWPGRRIHAIDRRRFSFAEVLASVDAVVSKPGYGIVSECIAAGKPLLHASRRDFREYPILVDAIERYLRQRAISEERLYSGDLGRDLEHLFQAPVPRETMPAGGADRAARRILDLARADL